MKKTLSLVILLVSALSGAANVLTFDTSLSQLKPMIDSMIIEGDTCISFDESLSKARDAEAVNDYISRVLTAVSSGTAVDTLVEDMVSQSGLKWLLRQDSDGYHYFIVNDTQETVYMPLKVSVDFEDALWEDPMTGEVYPAILYDNYIEFEIQPGQSQILRLYDHPVDKTGMRPRIRPFDVMEIDLSGEKWSLSFIETEPAISKTYKLKKLQPWTSLSDKKINQVSGVGVYTTTLKMSDGDSAYDWWLDLGEVDGSVRVYVNGELAGTLWAKPYVLSIGDYLTPGKNELSLEVSPAHNAENSGLTSAKLIRR